MPSRPCLRQRARAAAYSWLSTSGPSSACSKSDCPKCRELDLGVLAVEGDDVGEGARAVAGAGREVVLEAVPELGQQHQQLVVLVEVLHRREVGGVDDRRALGGEQLHRPLGVRVGVAAVAPVARSGDTDPLPGQASVDGVRGVVGPAAGEHGEQGGGLADRRGQRTG